MEVNVVESVIKMINRRVKGSEKFWSEPAARNPPVPAGADHPERDRNHEPLLVGNVSQTGYGRQYRRASMTFGIQTIVCPALTTTRGDVAWNERVANCPRCRRAFFPSGSRLGR